MITSFATAYIVPVKVLVQTAGELDFETIFNHSPLLYPVLSYILFVLFIIAMPILFNNFLVRVLVKFVNDVSNIFNIIFYAVNV